jgi:integrase
MLLLTDRVVDRLPPGSVVRDSKQVGLLIRVGKRSRTFRYELAHRSGDTRRTISQALGSRPHVTCEEARNAAARLDADRKAGTVPIARRTGATLGHAAAEHFAALGNTRWRAEAERFYRMHLSHWAGRSLASLSASPEVVDWHREVTKRRGPYAANHAARVLRAIYNRHREERDRTLPHDPPTVGLRRRWNPQPRRDAAMPFEAFPEWRRQVDAVGEINPIRAAYHRLCVLTGMRPGELARLRVAHVNLGKHELTVGKTKTGLDLTIPTSPQIEEQLAIALAAADPQWVFPAARGESGHLSHWREKGAVTYCGNAGRHTYRTVAASLGCDELSIRLLLGHSLSGVSQGYITRQLLVGTSLQDWQHRISNRVAELVAKSIEQSRN